jgi:alpha-tubulin suppressor-like RCC1 family protein
LRYFCATLAGVLLLSSCNPLEGPQEPVASVTLEPGAVTILEHTSRRMVVTLRDSAGTVLANRVITWTTSAASVATVDQAGMVTGVDSGSVTVTATSEGIPASASVTVRTAVFTAIAAGAEHTCALTATGAAFCWGRDDSGQLGAPGPRNCALASGTALCSPDPIAVDGGKAFTRITTGGAHTCALMADSTAWCWGNNDDGQLGDGTHTERPAPVAVSTALKFGGIDAGAHHTCALTGAGAAYCWGRNDAGQLGDGTAAERTSPVPVTGGLTFQVVSAGGVDVGHTCALTTGGSAWCWGDNASGQLGIDSFDVRVHSTPRLVSGVHTFTALSAGLGSHTCALSATGEAWCWGANDLGALGNGTIVPSAVPVQVVSALTFTQLVAGGSLGHTCAIDDNADASCWGDNTAGQLGDGSTNASLVPSPVTGAFTFTAIDPGGRHSCALETDGTLYCWGAGAAGQLGTGTEDDQPAPTKVRGQK